MHIPGVACLEYSCVVGDKESITKAGPDIAIPHSSWGLQAEAGTQYLPGCIIRIVLFSTVLPEDRHCPLLLRKKGCEVVPMAEKQPGTT